MEKISREWKTVSTLLEEESKQDESKCLSKVNKVVIALASFSNHNLLANMYMFFSCI